LEEQERIASQAFECNLHDVTDLAFTDESLVGQAKAGVLGASMFAAMAWFGLLRATLGRVGAKS
jgi:hypothetical protein